MFVIVLLGTLSWVALRDQFATREETMATLNVDAATNAVLAGIIDAETGQRGYLITRVGDYLEPFVQARARLRADLARNAAEGGAPDTPVAPVPGRAETTSPGACPVCTVVMPNDRSHAMSGSRAL